jgi:hypothetical protein
MKNDDLRRPGLSHTTGLDPVVAVKAALATVAVPAGGTEGDDSPGGLEVAFRLLLGRLHAFATLTRILADGLEASPTYEGSVSPADAAAVRAFFAPIADSAQVLASWAELDSEAIEAEGEEGILLAEFEDAAAFLAVQANGLREQVGTFEPSSSWEDE